METILKKKLIGEQLSSVEFVQDYVQLHFDGPSLTLYIWPTVIINNKIFRYGDSLYRDMLCSLISNNITQIDIEQNRYLKLFFEEKNYLELNLDSGNPEIIAEIGFFDDPSDNSWIVFE
ncbi:hypothetical protein [Dysgonomonas reticulitermitis]